MDFLDKRVTVITNELNKLKVKQSIKLDSFMYKEGNFLRPTDVDLDPCEWKTFNCDKDHWYGKDKHYWFRTNYTVEDSFNGKSLWLHISTQIDEWDDAKNPQFLLFINDKIIQGIDMNHRDVLITKNAKEGDVYKIDLQSYTGILHSEFNLIARIEEIDSKIEDLYYDLLVPLESFSRMDKTSKYYLDILNILNETVNLLDLRNPYDTSFYNSLDTDSKYIKKELYENSSISMQWSRN